MSQNYLFELDKHEFSYIKNKIIKAIVLVYENLSL